MANRTPRPRAIDQLRSQLEVAERDASLGNPDRHLDATLLRRKIRELEGPTSILAALGMYDRLELK